MFFSAKRTEVFDQHPKFSTPFDVGIKDAINESGLDVTSIQKVGFCLVPSLNAS